MLSVQRLTMTVVFFILRLALRFLALLYVLLCVLVWALRLARLALSLHSIGVAYKNHRYFYYITALLLR